MVQMLCLAAASAVASANIAEEPARALVVVRAVGPEGEGNAEAKRAWAILARQDAGAIPVLLAGIDDAGPISANWIRAAVDAIAERTLAQRGQLPADALEAFVLERHHAPRARRLAYEWLVRVDPSAEDRLIAGMLDDPSVELRRDAVARRSAAAEEQDAAGNKEKARELYGQALDAARDPDQVKRLSGRLGELGRPVDLPRHFGFITSWNLIGPFDNKSGIGFEQVHPPEVSVHLDRAVEGVEGPVRWIGHATDDDYGIVDLNKALGSHKGAVSYAYATFTADRSQPVEFRLGCPTAWKLWLNGELLFARPEYHRGMQLDQYRVAGRLKLGANTILLKVCQNEQTEDWAQRWQFQLRVCDASGTAVLSKESDQPAAGRP